MAFDRLEPIGGPHLDLLNAQLAAMMFNTTRSKKEDLLPVSEFVPKWRAEEADPEEAKVGIRAKIGQAFKAFMGPGG